MTAALLGEALSLIAVSVVSFLPAARDDAGGPDGRHPSTVSLKASYQQADAETTLRVVLGRANLGRPSEPPYVHTNVPPSPIGGV